MRNRIQMKKPWFIKMQNNQNFDLLALKSYLKWPKILFSKDCNIYIQKKLVSVKKNLYAQVSGKLTMLLYKLTCKNPIIC